MGLVTNLREQLAAQSLKRQLDRAIKAEQEPFKPTASLGAAALQDTGDAARRARSRFEAMPLYQQVKLMLQIGDTLHLKSPFFRVHEGMVGAHTTIDGRSYLNFSSYNYLGFSGDPAVSASAKAAIDRYGTSASASRISGGERPVQRELERALAKLYQSEDCVVFVSGHSTNVTTISSLVGAGDLVLHDALAHNSIVLGAENSGAKRLSFPHNDWRALDELLTRTRHEYRNVLIAIEGLYSMDGDYPDLARFVEVKRRHDAMLYVDDAHSLGVLGATGRGLYEQCGVAPGDVDIWMGTMSKTLASCGGFIAGCQPLVDMLRCRAPGFLYSTGLPPMLAAAALAALEGMLAQPERVASLRARGKQFIEEARAAGLNTGTSAGFAVIPILIGSSLKSAQWGNALYEAGICAQPIFYPVVPEKTARLRFFLCAMHQPEHITRAVQVMAKLAR
jgi:8-amino-7-oxononanoate synthase